MESVHPQKRKSGQLVIIKSPSQGTRLTAWEHRDVVATVTPGGEMPAGLNGVAFSEWKNAPTTLDAWAEIAGTLLCDEPPFLPPTNGATRSSRCPAASTCIMAADWTMSRWLSALRERAAPR